MMRKRGIFGRLLDRAWMIIQIVIILSVISLGIEAVSGAHKWMLR